MAFSIPLPGESLIDDHRILLNSCAKACRSSILEMVTNAQSGHPGGSLSAIDYLVLLYAFVISQTGEKLVVSNGHVSPAVYAILAEMGYIDKADVIQNFRKFGTIYEGHITRHVDGVWYGTGPLGAGVSAAAGFAFAERLKESKEKVFCVMGDGETQEGQVHEMIQFSKQHELDNLILFVDYNRVQLTAKLSEVIDIDIPAVFEAGGWHVIETDGHDFDALWNAHNEANGVSGKPVVVVGTTIMGKGVEFMEETGRALRSDWHGKAPKPEDIEKPLKKLELSKEEAALLDEFRETVEWFPMKAEYPPLRTKMEVDRGTPIVYEPGTKTDCRSAYGNALLDLAKLNDNILALTADLKGSVKTNGVSKELPEQYIECGIAEQHMISMAGGLSLDGYIPFASTFGAFISSRAKDQARVNDINYCNVKMVATHCGLSVGEDGPTHQAIDDMGSFLGMFNTMVIEPADANQCDRIIRYIASHYGNFYVRMGRHKFPVLLKEDGSLFYDESYEYEYGKVDVLREGTDLTLIASGSAVYEAVQAVDAMKEHSIELLVVSSLKQFDDTIAESVAKTKNVITVEDHNVYSGLGSQVARHLAERGVVSDQILMLGADEYQLSGTTEELYANAGIDAKHIVEACEQMLG